MAKGKYSGPGVYTDLHDLMALQYKARLLPAGPSLSVTHPLTGCHLSRIRGRGLNFEELRPYRIGDDIRRLDWKVTRRTGHPHVRVYSEEREQDTILFVDQRINMFFGSTERMKSVVAAELAALLAWQALRRGDRVGMMVFTDEQCFEVKPQRSHSHVIRLLNQLCRINHSLHAGQVAHPQQFNRVLKKFQNLATHNKHLWIVSDFEGADDTTRIHLKELTNRNTLSLAMVYDNLETELPDGGSLSVTDGTYNVDINTSDDDLRERFREVFNQKLKWLRRTLKGQANMILPLHTHTQLETQLRAMLHG